MSRAALALAVLALASPLAQATPQPEFPAPLLELGGTWIAEAEALGAPHAQKPWYAEAAQFLDSAKAARADGRLRSVMFDVETFTELVLTGLLLDEASTYPSEAEGKTFVLQRTAAWDVEAKAAWASYRERLNAMEDELSSLHAVEVALYSADVALAGSFVLEDREHLAREFPKQAGVDRGFTLALVRASHTALLDIQYAGDLLDALSHYEGLPPRLDRELWSEVVAVAFAPLQGNVPSHLEDLEAIAAEARAANESLLAVTVNLAEQRAGRATSIFIIYGDATSRGKNVTADATSSMMRQLNNTAMERPRDYGLLGVFTADAIDRAAKTADVAEGGRLELGVVISAWASLDHQAYAMAALAAASPVQPASTEPGDEETPLGLLAPLAALALVALARRRR